MCTKQFVTVFRTMAIGLLFLTFAAAQWPSAPANAAATDPIAHDPTMIKQGQYYYVFITGDAGRPNTYLPIKRSIDLIHWEELGPVFSAPPQWVVDTLGITPRDFWAPDINYFNGKYYLYYAASQFGVNNSVIGLATNATLDPNSPDYHWVDEGMVFRSQPGDSFNAIDPEVNFDQAGVWLVLVRDLDAPVGCRNRQALGDRRAAVSAGGSALAAQRGRRSFHPPPWRLLLHVRQLRLLLSGR